MFATKETKPWSPAKVISAVLIATVCVLILAAISIPNLLRSRIAADEASRVGAMRVAQLESKAQVSDVVAAVSGTVRRVQQTVEMSLRVTDPAAAAQQSADLAKRLGGYVENSQMYRGTDGAVWAQVAMRVPAARLDEARDALRQLGKNVDSENVKAADVTGEYVDLEATLRNYHAEEEQYLAIMRRAGSVKDTLAVAERLSDVRGRIERTQAQFNLLSRQVEMASLAVSLRAEVAAVAWSPSQNARQAWHDARQDLAGYADAMLTMLLRAPAVLAWFIAVVALAALAWRLLRWTWSHWFRGAVQQS